MPVPHSPQQNHLLAALPRADFERLSPHLELITMPLGEALYEPAREIRALEKQMHNYARNLEFEKAALARDQLAELRRRVFMPSV